MMIYEFLYNDLFALLNLPTSGAVVEQVVGVVNEKVRQDADFARFLLSKQESIISFLLTSDFISSRNQLVSVINSALKMSPSPDFILAFVRHEEILPHWKNVDQFFRPVFFYVKEFHFNNEEILEKLFSLLTDKLRRYLEDNASEREQCTRTVNFSHVFQIILTLIVGLNKSREYEERIIDEQFMEFAFSSSAHSFDFAALVTFFLKDNQAHTDRYIRFLTTNTSNNALSAHFASACSLRDSLTSHRMNWFFQAIKQRKLDSYDLGTFISDAAAKVSGDDACVTLMSLADVWMKEWLFTTQPSVRAGAARLIYAMFRSYPPFKSANTYGGVPVRPRDDPVEGTQIEREQLPLLFEALLGQHKLMCSASKSGSAIVSPGIGANAGNVPTSTYFEVLAWCVHYGHMEGRLAEKKVVLLKMLWSLSGLKNQLKCGVLDELRFLSQFALPDTFWDKKTVVAVLDTLSKIPSGQAGESYVDSVVSVLFPLLHSLAGQHATMIAASKIVRSSITCGRLSAQYHSHGLLRDFIVALAADGEALETLSKCIFASSLFTEQYETRNRHYLCLVGTLLGKGSAAVEEFKAQKCPQTVASGVLKLLNCGSFCWIIDDLELLGKFTIEYCSAFAQKQKQKQKAKPKLMKYLVDFWKTNKAVLDGVGQVLQQANTTLELAESVVEFMRLVWLQPGLVPITYAFLNAQPEDFYSRIHRDVRKKFAEFVIDVVEMSGNGAESVKLVIRDLNRLQKFDIFVADVFVILIGFLQKFEKHVDLGVLTPIVDEFIMKSDDLAVFGIEGFAMKMLNGQDELKEKWRRKCIELLVVQFNTIEESRADAVIAKVEIAKKFLSTVQCPSSAGRDERLAGIVAELKDSPSEKQKAVGSALEYFLPFIGVIE